MNIHNQELRVIGQNLSQVQSNLLKYEESRKNLHEEFVKYINSQQSSSPRSKGLNQN